MNLAGDVEGGAGGIGKYLRAVELLRRHRIKLDGDEDAVNGSQAGHYRAKHHPALFGGEPAGRHFLVLGGAAFPPLPDADDLHGQEVEQVHGEVAPDTVVGIYYKAAGNVQQAEEEGPDDAVGAQNGRCHSHHRAQRRHKDEQCPASPGPRRWENGNHHPHLIGWD